MATTIWLDADELTVRFDPDPPDDPAWESRVNLRGAGPLRVCSASPPGPPVLDRFPLVRTYSVPLLKSALQKAVRRRRTETAVTVAWQLARQDLDALLRRLPVIVMEDAVLHPELPFLVWLLIACGKGWNPSEKQFGKLLTAVRDVADCPRHDVPPKRGAAAAGSAGAREMHPRIADPCRAVLIRVCYGGTGGDMGFMRSFVDLWEQRMIHPRHALDWCVALQDLWQRAAPPVSCADVPPRLGPRDEIPEAVDFHCFPGILNELARRTGWDEKLVRETIWFWRSGAYRKTPITTYEDPLAVLPEADAGGYVPEPVQRGLDATQPYWGCIGDELDLLSPGYWAREAEDRPKRKRTGAADQRTILDFFATVK